MTVRSLMVELHRFGKPGSSFRGGDHYIRTAGGDTPAIEVTMDLDEETFRRSIRRLRYRAGASPDDVAKARATFASSAAAILDGLPEPLDDSLTQIDLVASAAELWAFPFEACLNGSVPRFADRARPVVLTRRIRGEFVAHRLEWPISPRILFAHAPPAADLAKAFIAQHVEVLNAALARWRRDDPKKDAGLLTVREVYDPTDLLPSPGSPPFTHVHILAHGAPVRDPELDNAGWGLRLGPVQSAAVPPDVLADALKPVNGLPVVVTIAACDSGNQAESAIPRRSFAQELHVRGIPVVVGSQLPLTMDGSVAMTKVFYDLALSGEDIRLALFEARATLHETVPDAHDWLSLVAYVRLPEGYGDHLVALRSELSMLEAARAQVDRLPALGEPPASAAEYEAAEARIRDRIASLQSRVATIDRTKKGLFEECQGLLASAHKRLAELLFRRASSEGADGAARRDASRLALADSLDLYRGAYASNIHHHWSGIQQLSLEAALTGKIANHADWITVVRAAELGRSTDFWAFGTLAEAHLLAPFAGAERSIEQAAFMIDQLKHHAPPGDSTPMETTRRQLNRYVAWWTNANDFFPGCTDLARDAERLVELI